MRDLTDANVDDCLEKMFGYQYSYREPWQPRLRPLGKPEPR